MRRPIPLLAVLLAGIALALWWMGTFERPTPKPSLASSESRIQWLKGQIAEQELESCRRRVFGFRCG